MIQIIDLRGRRDSELFSRLASRDRVEYGDVRGRVEEIIRNVREHGDRALIEYTKMFDGVELSADGLRVTEQEIAEAYDRVDKGLLEVIKRARRNIESFHERQKENSWFNAEKDGVILGQLYRALDSAGVYVPGGTAAYPSSVLMNIVPAKVAGVRRIVMVTPPGGKTGINPAVLAAANEAGADEIYKIGGAQAVAALAFGTETIPKVDKITGPGNIYVATAKRMVYGYCDIDMIAGPSEIVVVADESACPKYIAADMLSQAEHDPLASAILVTDSESIANNARIEILRQLDKLTRKEIAAESIKNYGAIVLAGNMEDAVEAVNRIAPEHLELCVREPFSLLGSVRNAGAIFLGNYASEPVGDYFAGPNHVLPTGGTARFYSPLNVGDFVKKSSVISYTKNALERIKNDIILFAEAEGLTAHANAIRARFE